MKNKFKWIGIVLSAMLIFGLLGCPEEEKSSPAPAGKGKDANLTNIVFGAAGDVIGDVIIADPLTGGEDGTYKTGTVAAGNVGAISLKDGDALKKEIKATVSNKATAVIVKGTSTSAVTAPALTLYDDETSALRIENGGAYTATTGNGYLQSGQAIFVRVTSEDEATINYYVFKVTTQNEVNTVTSVTINGKQVTSLGTPAATLAGVTTKGTASITVADQGGPVVAANSANPVGMVIKYALKKKDATTDPTFAAAMPTGFQLDDGDEIWLEVTSQTGKINYYKIAIEKGRNATLATLSLGGAVVGLNSGAATPGAAEAIILDNVEAVTLDGAMISTLAIVATFEDSAATLTWLKVTGATAPADTAITNPASQAIANFENNDFIYFKVTSQNGGVFKYYKVQIHTRSSMAIAYGQPNIKNPANPDQIDYIDTAVWDTVTSQLNVSRVNLNEMTPANTFYNTVQPGKNHTSAWAKAMWDDDGLYVYANVDFVDFYNSGTAGATTVRTFTSAPASASEHLGDNVEIFTNERYQSYKTGNYGNQFRIEPGNPSAASDVQKAIRISGVGGNYPSGQTDTWVATELRSRGTYRAWIRSENGKQVGYTVIAQVPWLFKANHAGNTSAVFGADGLVKSSTNDGPTVGMEIQLNCSTSTGTRAAILTWNGITGQSYQNCYNYGTAKLIMGSGTRRFPVGDVNITAQPQPQTYTYSQVTAPAVGTPALSVTATAAQATPELSYQWYRAANLPNPQTGALDATDTAIEGATSSTYSPSFPSTDVADATKFPPEGVIWYYRVEVTNKRTQGLPTGTNPEEPKVKSSDYAKVELTPVAKPIITVQPVGAGVIEDWAVELSVTANDISANTDIERTYTWYYWEDDGEGINDTTTGTGMGTGTEKLDVDTGNSKVGTTYYWVVIKDQHKTSLGWAATTSNKVAVTVVDATKASFDVSLSSRFTAATTAPGNTIDQVTNQISGSFRTPPAVTAVDAEDATAGIKAAFNLATTQDNTNQSLCFALSKAQYDVLMLSGVGRIKVELDIDPPTTTAGQLFQILVANPRVTTGATTIGYTAGTALAIGATAEVDGQTVNTFKTQTLTRATNTTAIASDLANSAFVIRKTATGDCGDVVIRSIKITVLETLP